MSEEKKQTRDYKAIEDIEILFVNNGMKQEDIKEILDTISESIVKKYKDYDVKDKTNLTLAKKKTELIDNLYYVIEGFYEINFRKSTSEKNILLKVILITLAEFIEESIDDLDFEDMSEYIKIVLEKYQDNTLEVLKYAIIGYIICEKKEQFKEIFKLLIVENDKPVDLNIYNYILGKFNFMILFPKTEEARKTNVILKDIEKVNLSELIEFAKVVINDKDISEEKDKKLALLFQDACSIVSQMPTAYIDQIQNNLKMVENKGCTTEKALENIHEFVKDMIKATEKEENAIYLGNGMVDGINFFMNAEEKDYRREFQNFLYRRNQGNSIRTKSKNKSNIDLGRITINVLSYLLAAAFGAVGALGVSNLAHRRDNNKSQDEYNLVLDEENKEIPTQLEALPVSIECISTEQLGTNGPEAETTIMAKVSPDTGRIIEISFIDEEGKQTLNTNLDSFADSLQITGQTVTSFNEEYEKTDNNGEIVKYEASQNVIVLGDPYIDEEGKEIIAIETMDGETYDIVPYEKLNISTLKGMNKFQLFLYGQEITMESKIERDAFMICKPFEDSENEVSMTQGQYVFGFPIIKDGELYIRTETQDIYGVQKQEDIPFSNIDTSKIDWKEEPDLTALKSILGSSLEFIAPVDTPVWDGKYSNKLMTYIPSGEKAEVAIYEINGVPHIGLVSNGFIIGEVDSEYTQEFLDTYVELTTNDQINEMSKDIYSSEKNFNGIIIPKYIATQSLGKYIDTKIISATTDEKMPDTESNVKEVFILEIQPNEDISEINARIEETIKVTGRPFGLSTVIKDDEEAKKIAYKAGEIKNGSFSEYFKYGVIMKPEKENYPQMIDGYNQWGGPIRYENEEHTKEIELIRRFSDLMREYGIKGYFADSFNNGIDVLNEFTDKEISLVMSVSIDNGNYSEGLLEYQSKLQDAGFDIFACIDYSTGSISARGKDVQRAMKQLAKEQTVTVDKIFNDWDIEY